MSPVSAAASGSANAVVCKATTMLCNNKAADPPLVRVATMMSVLPQAPPPPLLCVCVRARALAVAKDCKGGLGENDCSYDSPNAAYGCVMLCHGAHVES